MLNFIIQKVWRIKIPNNTTRPSKCLRELCKFQMIIFRVFIIWDWWNIRVGSWLQLCKVWLRCLMRLEMIDLFMKVEVLFIRILKIIKRQFRILIKQRKLSRIMLKHSFWEVFLKLSLESLVKLNTSRLLRILCMLHNLILKIQVEFTRESVRPTDLWKITKKHFII